MITCGPQEFRSMDDNKAEGRIAKLVFPENKVSQIFQRTNISNPVRIRG